MWKKRLAAMPRRKGACLFVTYIGSRALMCISIACLMAGDALLAYAVADSGHAWPGARDENHREMFGSRGDSPDASSLIADFFNTRMNARQAPTRRAENQGTVQ